MSETSWQSENRGEQQSSAASGLQKTADTARELAQTLERGADTLDRASRSVAAVSEKVDRVTQEAGQARDTAVSQVRQHPLVATGAAFAIGFLMGRS